MYDGNKYNKCSIQQEDYQQTEALKITLLLV